MNTPLQTIADGLTAARNHWLLLLGVVLVILAGSLFIYALLKWMFADDFTAEEYVSLSVGGWLLPAALVALIGYALGATLSVQIVLVVFPVLFLGVLGLYLIRFLRSSGSSTKSIALVLMLLTFFLILVRLAFAAKALLPLYFDSAQHYLLTRDLLANLDHPGTAWSLTSYYHLGFHFLTAFLTSLTGAPINDTMLVLGQMILALTPLPFFFLVRHETRSTMAGMFAFLLAATGWYMPAHAVDWGKYPALSSLALMPFVLGLSYLSFKYRATLSRQKYRLLNLFLLLGIAITVFLHSRALIVFGLIILSLVVTWGWWKMTRPGQLFVFVLLVAALAAGMYAIQSRGILQPLFDPYAVKGVLVTSAVLLLALFAYRSYSALLFACLLCSGLLLVSLFVPLGNLIPGYANMTLLDRPFVEMILYIPLVLLGGFGLAGLEQLLPRLHVPGERSSSLLGPGISVSFIVLLLVNAFFKMDPYPADCCDIASRSDLQAIRWMDGNLPPDARILIASTELNVLPTAAFQGNAGGDGGTWINPLIGRTTIFMPFTTDFSQPQTLQAICELQVNYVYVGKAGWAFSDAGMSAQPESYRLIFSLPEAKVYQVTGCNRPATTSPAVMLFSAADIP